MRTITGKQLRVGMTVSIAPTSNVNPKWIGIRLKVLDVAEEYVDVLALDSAPRGGPFEGPVAGNTHTISRSRVWHIHSGFGAWFKTHGGNDGKAAVL